MSAPPSLIYVLCGVYTSNSQLVSVIISGLSPFSQYASLWREPFFGIAPIDITRENGVVHNRVSKALLLLVGYKRTVCPLFASNSLIGLTESATWPAVFRRTIPTLWARLELRAYLYVETAVATLHAWTTCSRGWAVYHHIMTLTEFKLQGYSGAHSAKAGIFDNVYASFQSVSARQDLYFNVWPVPYSQIQCCVWGA